MKKENRGITLIALVITIIVLLVLAGVTIQTLTGENGLITKANEAKTATEESKFKEEIDLLLFQAKTGDSLKDIFAGGSITPDPEVEQTAVVYLVEYKGNKFLISNDFEYIPLVEPENPGDWKYSNDGTITGYIGTSTDVTIPNYIKGIKIKKIGGRVFSQNANIKKLTISNGIEEISYLGFQYGLNLEGDIIIPDSIISIPAECFRNCSTNGYIRLGKNIKTIGSNAFNGCSNLQGDLVIPDSVEVIDASAFQGCSSLNKIKFGNNVKTIGNRAFKSCLGLQGDLILPDSIEVIGWQAFNNTSLNGKLYIGKNIKTISSEAFLGLSNLTGDLVIGNSAEIIDSSAFSSCNKITSITFLKNDTVINNVPPNATIKGYTGSTAESYATANRKTFVAISE